jgi:hypothetical protein
MFTLSGRNKIAVIAIASVAVILLTTIPFAIAQTAANNVIANIKTFKTQGNAYQTIDSQTIKYYPSSLTLNLQPTSTSGSIKKFDVTGGTMIVNCFSYSITSGNGGLSLVRHIVLLQAEGIGPDGQAITLKLEGQYSYSWLAGRYIFVIDAKLQTDNGNFTLLMRPSIQA